MLDKLGPQLTSGYQELDRSSYVSRFVARTLATADNPWCDDDADAGARKPATTAASGWRCMAASTGSRRALGSDMTRWRWDAVHKRGVRRTPRSTPCQCSAACSGAQRRTAATGAQSTSARCSRRQPFEQHSLPGYRQIVDLSPANDSRFLEAVGQSGHLLSPHYDDALSGLERGALPEDADRARGESSEVPSDTFV